MDHVVMVIHAKKDWLLGELARLRLAGPESISNFAQQIPLNESYEPEYATLSGSAQHFYWSTAMPLPGHLAGLWAYFMNRFGDQPGDYSGLGMALLCTRNYPPAVHSQYLGRRAQDLIQLDPRIIAMFRSESSTDLRLSQRPPA